ncbi:teichoic acid transport system ATP-binding protein [Arthrobacter pigmenti]|uniref:Teichoic acid transport system ATP-binding protein n=1 Tax=Arthrobacter pigmenti TaxID=271432 RepID=A0A846RHK3_9MICC|nr:ATP-binding cassette domain-containing protein [Arthrobacter pigmenti]NJC22643.1 teichoic acid transport system ATP-binding protein [Arthrobacter pigmenti]
MDESTNRIEIAHDASIVVDGISVNYRTKRYAPATESRSSGPLSALRKRVNGGKQTINEALRDVSFVGYKGDSIGIIGRNGSGKSTLMRVLAGLTKPSSGSVYAMSDPVLLGVNAALISALSGSQNIRLGCLAMGMTESQIDRKYGQIVEMSGLEDDINHPMKSYSSGMSSRLRFAIAAAVDPEILLIDEALNTGDAQFKERSKNRMDEIRAQAGTVFLVSHSLGTIKANCNRCIWLDKGDFIMDGDTEAVTKEYRNFVWRMTEGNKEYGQKIRAELMHNRPPIQAVVVDRGWRSAKGGA